MQNYENSFNDQEEENSNEDYDYSGHVPYSASPLTKNQKYAAAGLAFFAFFVFIFWGIQFRKSIADPLSSGRQKSDINNSQNISVTDQDLRNKDTDGDGISDFDELNIYLTSPYLEDSDSDGVWDGDEINSNKNPNCPVGRDCSEDELDISEENKSLNDTASGIENNSIAPTGNSNGGSSDVEKVLKGQGDVETLRKMLLSSGMDQKILDQISDEDLLKAYRETLEKQE